MFFEAHHLFNPDFYRLNMCLLLKLLFHRLNNHLAVDISVWVLYPGILPFDIHYKRNAHVRLYLLLHYPMHILPIGYRQQFYEVFYALQVF